jgi:hypothetical protein
MDALRRSVGEEGTKKAASHRQRPKKLAQARTKAQEGRVIAARPERKPMEFMFGRPLEPEELELLRKQIESMDDITAIDDEVRGIVERNWPHLLSKLPPQQEEVANGEPATEMNINANKDWSEMDLADLANGLANGNAVEDIAEFLCRDVDEVRAKADKLKSTDRQTAKLT